MREDIKHAIDLSIFPPDLAEVIAAHAAMFGATRMETDTPPAEAAPEQAQDAGQQKDTFRPIASQDELDRIVTARLSRERAKYADYDEKSQKAAQYDQMQESAKTEAQKQQERLDTMSNDNLQLLRENVALRKGLQPELAARLSGATREEMEADADQLKALLTPQAPDQRRFDPVPGQGTGRQDANANGFESGAQRARNKIKTI